VYGRGVSFSLTEITPELAKQLTETGLSYDDFDELEMNELEDTDEDECGITLNLEVHVDGEKIANPYEGFSGIEQAKNVRPFKLGHPGKYYYVNIMEENGLWLKAEMNEPFDPKKLQIDFRLCSSRQRDHQVGGAFIWRTVGHFRIHRRRCK
jgi:hypothetical protein